MDNKNYVTKDGKTVSINKNKDIARNVKGEVHITEYDQNGEIIGEANTENLLTCNFMYNMLANQFIMHPYQNMPTLLGSVVLSNTTAEELETYNCVQGTTIARTNLCTTEESHNTLEGNANWNTTITNNEVNLISTYNTEKANEEFNTVWLKPDFVHKSTSEAQRGCGVYFDVIAELDGNEIIGELSCVYSDNSIFVYKRNGVIERYLLTYRQELRVNDELSKYIVQPELINTYTVTFDSDVDLEWDISSINYSLELDTFIIHAKNTLYMFNLLNGEFEKIATKTFSWLTPSVSWQYTHINFIGSKILINTNEGFYTLNRYMNILYFTPFKMELNSYITTFRVLDDKKHLLINDYNGYLYLTDLEQNVISFSDNISIPQLLLFSNSRFGNNVGIGNDYGRNYIYKLTIEASTQTKLATSYNKSSSSTMKIDYKFTIKKDEDSSQ